MAGQRFLRSMPGFLDVLETAVSCPDQRSEDRAPNQKHQYRESQSGVHSNLIGLLFIEEAHCRTGACATLLAFTAGAS